MICPIIDISSTRKKVINHLEVLMHLFKLEICTIEDFPLYKIDEIDFNSIVSIKHSTEYDELVRKLLSIISQLEERDKIIIYYRYIKGYTLHQLHTGYNEDNCLISKSYNHHKQAIAALSFMLQDFVEYKGVIQNGIE